MFLLQRFLAFSVVVRLLLANNFHHPELSPIGDIDKPALPDLPFVLELSFAAAASLTATPTHLKTENGSEVATITWSNVDQPSKNDWIGIYSPSTAANSDYLDFFYNPEGKAAGEYDVKLFNMRDDYQFRYFQETSKSDYNLVTISNNVTVDAKQPLQGHISLTKNSPFEMRVTWVSAMVQNPQIQMGQSSKQYTSSVNAQSYTYDTTNMCQSTAATVSAQDFRDPGYMFEAIANNLKPDTRYYYRFGYSQYWSEEYSFMTGSDPKKVVLDSSPPFTFAMYGDMGPYPNSYTTVSRVSEEIGTNVVNPIELLLHIGDISYARGHGYMWDQFSNMVEPIAASVPYMIEIGNHEYDHTSTSTSADGKDISGCAGDGYHPNWGDMGNDSDGECGVPVCARFKGSENGNLLFWYSFDYKYVHFIMISAEHDLSPGSVQYHWLANDLAAVNRTQTPWTVLGTHRPLYCSQDFPSDEEVSVYLLQEIESLLYDNEVDIVLSGHYHSYQRTCPVFNQSCVKNGITHIMIGTAGIDLDQEKFANEPWSEFTYKQDYGHGRFTVNRTDLAFEFITNAHASVTDSVHIHKN